MCALWLTYIVIRFDLRWTEKSTQNYVTYACQKKRHDFCRTTRYAHFSAK